MGNRQPARNDDFHKILSQMRKDQTKRVNINPDKKYLTLMKDTLGSSKLPNNLKKLILETLMEKVSEVELIQTVTCINALRNNEMQSSFARSQIVLKERPESKFVRVNFGEGGFLKKMWKNFNFILEDLQDTPNHQHSPSPSKSKGKFNRNRPSEDQFEMDRKQRLKVLNQVMKKQLNRMIHPFGKLNKAFAQYIEGNSSQFAPENCKQDIYERNVQRLINQWCLYLQSGCLQPYKKWIMHYTDLEEGKYGSWIRNLLIQEIWVVNNGYLFMMLATVIQRRKVPLDISIKQLGDNAALLTPSLFSIDSKLQIQGHFFDSIYEMSEIVSKFRPQNILSQLQTVKKRVCTDIDNYHRLVQLGEVYEIDSDNILGIVAYILCKIASKIDQIHTHLIFLRIVYGEKVYFSMGLGSYMLSTVFGALQFLQSGHFRQLMLQKKGTSKQTQGKQVMGKSNQDQTKVGTSLPGENNSIPELSQGDRSQKHTNSLLQRI